MVVLAVMGLLIFLVLGHRPAVSQLFLLRETSAALAQSLRTARADAIARDISVTMIIDPLNRQFGSPGHLYQWPAGVSVSQTPLDPAGIVFIPDGSALGGTVTLRLGTLRDDVTVNWLTGRVTVTDVQTP